MPSGYVVVLSDRPSHLGARAREYRDGGDVLEWLVETDEALVVIRHEKPDSSGIGRYCEVSARGSVLGVYDEGALADFDGGIHKMTDDECLQVAAMVLAAVPG